MFLFWICAGVLTVATVLVIARPLSRSDAAVGGSATPGEDADVAMYRDQLAGIDADLGRGILSALEADAARVEIARRLLARADQGAKGGDGGRAAAATPGGSRERFFLMVAAVIPAVALGLYIAQGSPGMPGQPVAARLAKAPAGVADIDELLARVEARLRADPSDGQGWEVIAPVYLKMERFWDAAEAYRRSIKLLGETARRLSGLAESVVLANDGIVTEEARLTYERVLVLDADRIEARFGLALAMEQDGDVVGAHKAYEAMLETSPPRAPWRPYIVERLDALAEKLGAEPKTAAPAAAQGSAEASIAALPEAERRQVVLQMVDNLAQRLKANGRDAEGWQRLMRSWMVLGETAKAEAALADARKALGGDAKGLGEINAFAKELGLKS
jgi:cytochrome c-type biogenesis protein CcmH